MIDGSLSTFNLPEDRRYGMFIHVVARHQKHFRQMESQTHIQFSCEWAVLNGIWVVWNSGEVLPDRIK